MVMVTRRDALKLALAALLPGRVAPQGIPKGSIVAGQAVVITNWMVTMPEMESEFECDPLNGDWTLPNDHPNAGKVFDPNAFTEEEWREFWEKECDA